MPAEAPDTRRTQPRILVIEDDVDQGRCVSAVLTEEGYAVTLALRGADGLLKARQAVPDLILLDVMMPGIDGFKVADQIAEDAETKHTPILFLSASDDLIRRVRGLQKDGVDFLQKPYTLEELLARVERALSQGASRKRLRAQAGIDELTGLGNLRLLHERLGIEQSRLARYGTPFTVVAIDVDKLKLVNDMHGHAAGSEVLRAIGTVLRDSIREIDLAVRCGGDEFVVLLPHADQNDGMGFADRVLTQIRTLRPEGIGVSVSMGLGSFGSGEPRPLELLLREADRAAYRAKRQGGDRACAFDPTLDAAT